MIALVLCTCLIRLRLLTRLSLLPLWQFVDDAKKQVNFENAFTFLAPTCPVAAKAAKKGMVLFEANVLSTNMKAQAGLGGDCEKPGKGRTGVALLYHKNNKFQALSVEQKAELNE